MNLHILVITILIEAFLACLLPIHKENSFRRSTLYRKTQHLVRMDRASIYMANQD